MTRSWPQDGVKDQAHNLLIALVPKRYLRVVESIGGGPEVNARYLAGVSVPGPAQ